MKRPSNARLALAVRWAVVAVALVGIAVGLALGDQLEVFWKAATICLECIGIA